MTHVLRIAHGFGNRRSTIDRAVAAGVDYLEADLRFDRGRIWVRHEHRVPGTRLLFNHRLAARHRHGPWAATVGPYFFRLDRGTISFRELLGAIGGRIGLLLDLKASRMSRSEADRFAAAIKRELSDSTPAQRVMFCGNWRALGGVGRLDPESRRFYSVDSRRDWALIERHLPAGRIRGLSLHRSLVTPSRAARLRELGVEFLAWDIETSAEAEAAVACGAAGILSSSLAVLASLGAADAAATSERP